MNQLLALGLELVVIDGPKSIGHFDLKVAAERVVVAAADVVVAEEAVVALVDLSNVATVEDSDVLW